MAPIPGEGYEFVDEIKGGAIPNGLIPAVDKGVREAMEEGFLAGYPMVDIKCTVFDGSYHSVDSNEMAFKTAARIGFRACCENAGPIILEPWATMEVTVGEEYAGTIMGDISTRRGRIVGTDAGFAAGETIIKMRAPYAEVINYTKDLRSMTRGSGSYTLDAGRLRASASRRDEEARGSLRGRPGGGELASCLHFSFSICNVSSREVRFPAFLSATKSCSSPIFQKISMACKNFS